MRGEYRLEQDIMERRVNGVRVSAHVVLRCGLPHVVF